MCVFWYFTISFGALLSNAIPSLKHTCLQLSGFNELNIVCLCFL